MNILADLLADLQVRPLFCGVHRRSSLRAEFGRYFVKHNCFIFNSFLAEYPIFGRSIGRSWIFPEERQGLQACEVAVEIIGQVTPSDYRGKVILLRQINGQLEIVGSLRLGFPVI